ncbi:sulfite exporter TauE/SafE family protein [Variovorax sp. NFACC27]|uniref:sulfite exporter TauE/SafE family protein n=1 Tax=unclassified Variovorax TaxID=663243 RepID=UPI000895669C|nr:hypothetical protein SAMN03159371_03316 [Variovorax sp. NFACC28]SEG70267.1 hypothetical protein SAMN03159365_03209 [Variovorax sp. NFACC29]SFC82953.1 hypothetical protein SAMN03159379_03285 [Variovorax sp. NFACC26]SFF98156.1 hypothetical protein SAMN03159447_01206 [Variovorax sp. NFACC27]
MLQGYMVVLTVSLMAGVLSGVVGTGSSVMLLPVLVNVFGPKEAVPVMAVAAVVGNAGRALAWWRDVDWRAVGAYSLPGAPAAALGARTLWAMPGHAVDIALGLFFVLLVPTRHFLRRRQWRLSLSQLAVAGAVTGFLTGLVLSTGPLSVPLFTAYGLLKGAFLGTEAVSALVLYSTKVVTFSGLGALPFSLVLKGLIIGGALTVGTFIGKFFVLRLPAQMFQRLLDCMMLLSGLALLAAAR